MTQKDLLYYSNKLKNALRGKQKFTKNALSEVRSWINKIEAKVQDHLVNGGIPSEMKRKYQTDLAAAVVLTATNRSDFDMRSKILEEILPLVDATRMKRIHRRITNMNTTSDLKSSLDDILELIETYLDEDDDDYNQNYLSARHMPDISMYLYRG